MSVVMVTRPPQKLRNVLIWKGFIRGIKEDRLWRSEARQIICSLSRHHFYITRFPAGCHSVTHICETTSKVHRLRTLEAYHQCNTVQWYLAQNNHNLADLPLSFLWKSMYLKHFKLWNPESWLSCFEPNQIQLFICQKRQGRREFENVVKKKGGLKLK